MFAYVLFCRTQKAKTAAALLEMRGNLRAFSPQIIRRHRVRGKNVDIPYDLLPGYVFVYSETELMGYAVFRGVEGAIRWLGSAENNFALTGADYDFAMRLYQKNGVVGQVTLFKVGDTVVLDDPLFAGCDGKITQIDNRKQRARVEYRFAGMDCFTWIACDLISNVKPTEHAPEKDADLL